MQEQTKEESAYRLERGYEAIELLGWASAPFYDAKEKKLHWAKEYKFGESRVNILNYNIRILGRGGFLQMNAVGDIYMLDSIQQNIDPIPVFLNVLLFDLPGFSATWNITLKEYGLKFQGTGGSQIDGKLGFNIRNIIE